jgi:adenylosuccinate lyase
MSDRIDDIEPALAALEARVTRAVARIRELAAENRRLKAAGAGAGIPAAPATSGGNGAEVAALEARVRELDRERAALVADRRALTQRVEEILARLEYLESETVAH